MTYKISVFSLSSLQYHITVCFSEVGYKESAEMSEFWMCYEIFILIIFFSLSLSLSICFKTISLIVMISISVNICHFFIPVSDFDCLFVYTVN